MTNWQEFDIDNWRSAMFKAEAYFHQLCIEQVIFTENILKKFAKESKIKIIEIGSGTGDYLRAICNTKTIKSISDEDISIIGIDYNKKFIDWCSSYQDSQINRKKITWLLGDAARLENTLINHNLQPSKKEFIIISCVGNTLGIINDKVKKEMYSEMQKVIGSQGVVFLSYWDGDCFGNGLQHFYAQNPQLCGTLTDAKIDWKNTKLETESGYITKWTSAQEAKSLLEDMKFKVHCIEAKAKGVMVCASTLSLPSQ